MYEAKVLNFALIGMFLIMLCAFLFIVQSTTGVIGAGTVTTTVSAFCG